MAHKKNITPGILVLALGCMNIPYWQNYKYAGTI
jgi:hypothetical protein